MAKTIQLREAVKSKIVSALTSFTNVSVYYGQAQTVHTEKYVIFTLEELARSDNRISVELEINCICSGTDTSTCENMTDSIQAAFDHTYYFDSNIAFESYAGVRNIVESEDATLIRRRTTFDLYLYERGNS